MSVANLVEAAVKLLVSEPDEVTVSESEDRGAHIYSVTVAQGDVGRVIGKDGRVISCVRQIVSAVGSQSRIKTVVKVNTD
ncbi:KH domain-containing protein [Kamptonema cortianum]|nr:KH domain-containing protein [Geitlerinema splendidum]MDK3156079.1 KH domain-containing protein [Kamptonema cortianum]